MSDLPTEVRRRRTFAIISHPDAGKTTLTEKLLLFSGAIQIAGSVKARKASRHATSDWMEIEKQRGISVASSVMQMEYRGCVINLLDTPGHQDFSEDTYRVLTAVDAALMVIDAANGVEPQTRRLLQVCRARNTPILTFVNKMDREVQEPLNLMDEIERDTVAHVMELTEDRHFFHLGRILHHDLEQETVELRFGQPISSFLLHGVLRGQHHEGLCHRIGLAIHGGLSFFHDLQQGRLRFGRSTVDLIHKDDIAEHGTFLEFEGRLLRIEHRCTEYIGRHQVRRELDAAETGIHAARDEFSGKRLCHTGHPFNEHVTIGQQCGDDEFHHFVLTNDDLADLITDGHDRIIQFGQIGAGLK